MSDFPKEQKEKRVSSERHRESTPISEFHEGKQTYDEGKESCDEKQAVNFPVDKNVIDTSDLPKEKHKETLFEKKDTDNSANEKLDEEMVKMRKEEAPDSLKGLESLNISGKSSEGESEKGLNGLEKKDDIAEEEVNPRGTRSNLEKLHTEEESEPVFDGTEVPGVESSTSSPTSSRDNESQRYAWPEKAVAVKNFVREKSVVAVSNVLRHLSGKSNGKQDVSDAEDENSTDIRNNGGAAGSSQSEVQEASQKSVERSGWNPLSLIGISREVDEENNAEKEDVHRLIEPIVMKGRIMLYTRLGCHECKEARLFFQSKRLRYVEINIDVYPGRKLELEKIAGSSAVPRVFFNDVLIGGWIELKSLDDSGKLEEKIEYVVTEAPSFEAPLPPLSGEDDLSSSGSIDELALVVRKMKDHIIVQDRFYKMRRFTNCFLGSEAVDFLSEDQYLEREEAIEFGRKLASKLFLQHILDENVFEDGNHLYRFLDDDPFVSKCQNIARGIIEAKPKPIVEISSRLRFLFYAILEAYTSEDGKHVDYRNVHGSEEFARYLRIIEELQRVELYEMPREEKLAFFINLYNMMAIHAILVWGHPSGPLERRKLFGEFKYVIGGCTFSLSAIYNGILRANQRPPYNLIKPFGAKDKRVKVSLPYPEPLVHFALVTGTRSGPSLLCYSPGNIDKELMEAAHNFLSGGGLIVDLNAKIAYVNKILRWYSSDFGKNEVEVLKHAANYLEPEESRALLELLSSTQLKVVYQPYDWELNH